MKSTFITTILSALALLSLGTATAKTYTVVVDKDSTPEQAANTIVRHMLTEMGNQALEKRAAKGDKEAMLELGQRIATRDYLPDDQKLACSCLKMAAETGDATALFEMGRFAIYGFGMEKNPAEAAEWFRKAGEAGNSEGWRLLGTMTYNGMGIKANTQKAIEYW